MVRVVLHFLVVLRGTWSHVMAQNDSCVCYDVRSFRIVGVVVGATGFHAHVVQKAESFQWRSMHV